MVTAYLEANDAYWRRTDELPRPPDKWRTGTPREATTESLRAALAAAPKGPVPDAWQPIETAPKDGRDIILYRRGVVHSAHWDKDYYNGGEWMSGKHVAAFGHIDPPTHWMPLPAAPKHRRSIQR